MHISFLLRRVGLIENKKLLGFPFVFFGKFLFYKKTGSKKQQTAKTLLQHFFPSIFLFYQHSGVHGTRRRYDNSQPVTLEHCTSLYLARLFLCFCFLFRFLFFITIFGKYIFECLGLGGILRKLVTVYWLDVQSQSAHVYTNLFF